MPPASPPPPHPRHRRLRLAAGDRAGARALFEQTEQTRVYEYFEYIGARQRLRQLPATP